jgi:peroxiredoxin
MKTKFTIIAVKIMVAIFWISCSTVPKSNDDSDNDSMIELVSAPAFTLESSDGNSVSSKSLLGRVLVIHIATTWCPYCNAEAPNLEILYNDYKEKGVEVLIIDVKESRELVNEKLKDKLNLTFPLLLDTDGSVAASFAPQDLLPELARDEIMLASNILIDRNGKIQFMSLLDTKNFDVELVDLKKKLDELL